MFHTISNNISSGEGRCKATLDATEAYNYNASDADPRSCLLCTTQGIALQQDGKGKKRLYHHAVDSENKIHRYWLEAERSKHKVGGEQKETKEERDDAIAVATSSVIESNLWELVSMY